MGIISVRNLTKSYAGQTVLNDVNFTVNSTVKAALLGKNGSGKSTLLKIISSQMSPDSGEIIVSKHSGIGGVSQDETYPGSVFGFMLKEYEDLLDLENKMEDNPLAHELDRIMEEYEKNGGYEYKARVKMVLKGLGFSEDLWDFHYDYLSGGQKIRLKLARVLAGRSDILLLDEPTNHLDINMIIWLENFIKTTDKTVLFVTHDKRFVRNTANEILYLVNKGVKHVKLGYDEFIKYLDTERSKAKKQNKLISKKKEELDQFIRKYRAGIKSKQVAGREQMLADLNTQQDELFRDDSTSIGSFELKKNEQENALVLNTENLTIGYENIILQKNIDLHLYKGEKAALVGLNGTGKTTLIKVIMGLESELAGEITLGNKIKVGYLDQGFAGLNFANTFMDELLELDTGIDKNQVLKMAARFGFESHEVAKKIDVLSGGEKTRLYLIKLIYKGANFLILDEPTNHLDIESVDALLQALKEYDGTIMFVSHDRYFIKSLADKYFVLNEKGFYTEKSDIDTIISDHLKSPENKGESGNVSDKKNSQPYKRVNKFKVNKVLSETTEMESKLKGLYAEKKNNATDWQKLADLDEKIDSLEEELIYKYDELEKLEKGEL